MAEEKVNTGVVDVDSPESVFQELRGEISRITILRDGNVLDRVYPEQVDDDVVFWVKDRYGGGRYNLILFGKDGKIRKRLSFVIDGPPKHPGEEKGEEGTLKLVEKLIEKLEEKKGSSPGEFTAVFQMMMQMQQQQFQLLLQTLKPERRESSFVERFIDKVLSNPAVLMSAGGGLWKLLQKALSNKNELLELIKVAKADPELKELAIQAVGAKYGAGGGIIDRILSNPELLNRTLEIVNKALTIREAGQNPIPAVKKELRELAGAPRKEVTVSGIGSSPVSNPQSTQASSVENGAEVVSVQEVIAIGTKVLDMAEKGLNAGQIWDSLSDREVDVLIAVMEEYNIKDADGLVRFLEGLPVPRFTIAGYIEAIKRHREVIDELLSFCIAEEVEESSQEGNQEQLQVSEKAESGQVKRETKGDLQGESQDNYRQVTGEG